MYCPICEKVVICAASKGKYKELSLNQPNERTLIYEAFSRTRSCEHWNTHTFQTVEVLESEYENLLIMKMRLLSLKQELDNNIQQAETTADSIDQMRKLFEGLKRAL